MESRDRLVNLAIFGAAAVVWVLVGAHRHDARSHRGSGGRVHRRGAYRARRRPDHRRPIVWLLVFGRHRRIAYRGDWTRAARRGGWIGLIVAIFIVLRLQGALELPIALFILVLAAVAEATLSAER